MSIQYAGGTIVSASIAADDRATLTANIITQLTNAGWSVDVNTSSTDKTMKTATTPQSLNIRVRVYDPGSGNCVKLKMSNASGSKTQTGDVFLLPGAAKTFRIIANKYQFFIFTPGAIVAREFAAAGTPYLPSFLSGVITEAGWLTGNASSDVDSTNRGSLRTFLGFFITSSGSQTQTNSYFLCNGNVFEWNNTALTSISAIGVPTLLVQVAQNFNGAVTSNYRWHDDSILVYEPLMSWPLAASTDEAKIRGQMWDAMITSDTFAGDTTFTSFDGHSWWAVTNNYTGSVGIFAKGTLFIATS
jgi:hypothetical protein